MAHLANDLLPESFDVIVDGTGRFSGVCGGAFSCFYPTGLTLSVLAGALARTGRSVLHLDRYGWVEALDTKYLLPLFI